MQYSYKGLLKKYLKNYHLSIYIKAIVLLVVVYFIFSKLYNEEQLFNKILNEFYSLIHTKTILYLLVPLLLVPLNWSVEAKKWQLLAAKISPINFKQAISGVLSGLSLGFISPQSLGDYAGRIWYINSNRRSELIGSVFLGSVTQAIVSVIGGIFGITYFLNASQIDVDFIDISFVLASASGVGIDYIILFKGKFYRNFLPQIVFSWGNKYLGVISTYSSAELIQIFLLSLFRYLIFFIQFVWVLILFGIDLPLDVLCAGVSWIYAAKTIIPAFNFLSDIGVREFSALLFFNSYDVDVTKIILASLLIWIINILIPTITGSFLMLKMRIFSK